MIKIFFCYEFPNLKLITKNAPASFFQPPCIMSGIQTSSVELHLLSETLIQDAPPTELPRFQYDIIKDKNLKESSLWGATITHRTENRRNILYRLIHHNDLI